MSPLKDKINDDMKAAMRAKDSARLLTIRGLLASLKQKEVDERVELDDVAVIAIVDKLVKQRKDSITQFTAGGRQDLVDKESAELAVLEAYLPQRMGADEVAAAKKQRDLYSLRREVESDLEGRQSIRGFERSLRDKIAAGRTCGSAALVHRLEDDLGDRRRGVLAEVLHVQRLRVLRLERLEREVAVSL